MAYVRDVTRAVARCFLAGWPSIDRMRELGTALFGRQGRWRWVRPLAARCVKRFGDARRPHYGELAGFLLDDAGFERARFRYASDLRAAAGDPPVVRPAAGWPVPEIATAGDLAVWLGITAAELDWFADLKGLAYKRSERTRLAHYSYRVLAKGGGGVRVIEAPKQRLKAIQRQILAEILEKIPPHAAAQGFVKGRSILSFAAPHTGRRVLLRMDLSDFFPSIGAARIQTLFRTAGYPETVADLLAGICTNAVPRRMLRGEARALYGRPHLPQGAPTSPAIANLCMYRADCRLTGLARAGGAAYTRYADDIAFSGDGQFERSVERFAAHAAMILREEGFAVRHRKTRIMRQGVRQKLAGLVANQRVNVPRRDFDRLKATLTNCARSGPAGQNRDGRADFRAHLEGRVAFVESVNRGKGARLRKLLAAIDWR